MIDLLFLNHRPKISLKPTLKKRYFSDAACARKHSSNLPCGSYKVDTQVQKVRKRKRKRKRKRQLEARFMINSTRIHQLIDSQSQEKLTLVKVL